MNYLHNRIAQVSAEVNTFLGHEMHGRTCDPFLRWAHEGDNLLCVTDALLLIIWDDASRLSGAARQDFAGVAGNDWNGIVLGELLCHLFWNDRSSYLLGVIQSYDRAGDGVEVLLVDLFEVAHALRRYIGTSPRLS